MQEQAVPLTQKLTEEDFKPLVRDNAQQLEGVADRLTQQHLQPGGAAHTLSPACGKLHEAASTCKLCDHVPVCVLEEAVQVLHGVLLRQLLGSTCSEDRQLNCQLQFFPCETTQAFVA